MHNRADDGEAEAEAFLCRSVGELGERLEDALLVLVANAVAFVPDGETENVAFVHHFNSNLTRLCELDGIGYKVAENQLDAVLITSQHGVVMYVHVQVKTFAVGHPAEVENRYSLMEVSLNGADENESLSLSVLK